MSRYTTLNDPTNMEEMTYAWANCAAKFCNFGLVTSQKWTSVYITILDGIVRVYDSRESCNENEHNDVFRIVLNSTGKYRASDVKVKNYSNNPSKVIEFHSFYIEIDNGMFAPTRLIKIGCYNAGDAQRLKYAIKLVVDSD